MKGVTPHAVVALRSVTFQLLLRVMSLRLIPSPMRQVTPSSMDMTPYPMTSDGLSRMPEDVDMEFGLGGMDMSMMSGQPLSNRPYVSFGINEFAGLAPGTGFPDVDAPVFNTQTQMHQPQRQASTSSPQAHAQARAQGQGSSMHLDFTPDELAMMDQIMRQQFNQQGINYGMQAQPRFDPLQ